MKLILTLLLLSSSLFAYKCETYKKVLNNSIVEYNKTIEHNLDRSRKVLILNMYNRAEYVMMYCPEWSDSFKHAESLRQRIKAHLR